MASYIDDLVEQRQLFKQHIKKPKAPKLDAKFQNRVVKFLVSNQIGQEPTPAQVAYKAYNLIKEIVESDQKNIFSLTNTLTNYENFYRKR